MAQLRVIEVNSTTRWENCSSCPSCQCSGQMQIMDVTIQNEGKTKWITSKDRLTIQILSSGMHTVRKASIKRLMPGDSAIVEVGVQNQPGIAAGSTGQAIAVAEWGHSHQTSMQFNATQGLCKYNETASSVNTHESPSWLRNAKFGIFIHWGIYSVPAYGAIGKDENYAEW